MSDQPRTRQEIYERLRQTGREGFVLEDMIRLGFWPRRGEMPNDPAEEIHRRLELQKQLDALRDENRRLFNEKALLKEARERRLAESRQKQRETKERRERDRQARAEAWRERRQREIVHLGEGVSGGLSRLESDAERLTRHGLPVFNTPVDVALAMGVTLDRLRFLTFSRRVATVSHYVRFTIPKKTGGERLISAPMPYLKTAQLWLYHAVLARVAVHDAAHGFRPGRGIVSNAAPHVGANVVVNLDLKNFFPTITYARVRGVFRSLGYSEAVATVFALLCTEPDVEEIELDGKRYFVAVGPRVLPQGAPTSPAITNVLCRRLDKRLAAEAEKLGFRYTRYADDLTFSTETENAGDVGKLLRRVRGIVAHEGFTVHPDKTRVLRASRRQEVTGIVVNRKPAVARDELKRFRAVLFHIEKDGPAGKRWGNSPDVLAAIHGYANFVAMVDPEKGNDLRDRVAVILTRYGWTPPKPIRPPIPAPPPAEPPRAPEPPPKPDTAPDPPAPKPWWKMF